MPRKKATKKNTKAVTKNKAVKKVKGKPGRKKGSKNKNSKPYFLIEAKSDGYLMIDRNIQLDDLIKVLISAGHEDGGFKTAMVMATSVLMSSKR